MTALSIQSLSVSYGSKKAVDDVSMDLRAGEILGVVGESGSGKSTLARAVMHLLPHNATVHFEELKLEGEPLLALDAREWRRIRGARITLVPQNPLVALNPFLRVGNQVTEAVTAHRSITRKKVRELAVDILREVGIPQPESRVRSYPHQLSGGMRQRVLIAMALVNQPAVIIADEPTTALDVTVQAQILRLLQREVHDRGASLLLITHDMGVVSAVCDEIVVMRAGKIVERGKTREVIAAPKHDYTKILIESAGEVDPTTGRFETSSLEAREFMS